MNKESLLKDADVTQRAKDRILQSAKSDHEIGLAHLLYLMGKTDQAYIMAELRKAG